MRKFKALLVLNLKAMFYSFRFGRSKKRISGVGAAAIVAFIGLYISGSYSFLLASQLAPLGMVRLVVLLMPVLVVCMGLMFTVFAAQGVVFGGRDNDLVLSLPVPAFLLLLSRTLALYLENLLFAVFVMVPAGVVYLIYGGPGGAGFFLRLLLCTVLLALLPTALDLLVGFVLAWLSGRFGRRPLVSNLLYSGAFILLMIVLFRLNLSMSSITLSAALGVESSFSAWGVPFLLLTEAACDGNLLSLALFMALCILPFLLVVWLFSGRYGSIVTSLGARSSRSDYKLGALSAAGARRALLRKESGRFFSTPIYFFNAGFGLVLMVVGGAAALAFRGQVENYLRQMRAFADLPMTPILCAILAFLVCMTAITASSVSLEGKMLWILKEAPISVGDIFAVKVGFQLLLELPCLLAAAVCLTFAFSLGAADALVLFLVNAVLSLFCALFGLFINLSMPRLDAPNDTVVVKQSGAAMLGAFVPMLLVVALGFGWTVLQDILGMLPALLLCAALPALGSAALLGLLNTKGKSLWLEL